MFRNRWVRRVGITFGVLVVLVVVVFFYVRHTAGRQGLERLTAVTAATDAADPNWRLDDLDAARGQLPDAENSARLVPRFKAARNAPHIDATRPDKSDVFQDVPQNRRLDDEGIDAIDRVLAENGAARAVARDFRNYPKGLRRYQITPDVIGTLLPDVQESREIAVTLDLEAEWLAHQGQHGAGLQMVLALINVARSLDGEPFLISALVRIAIDAVAVRRTERALALGEPAGGLAEVQAALLKEAEGDVFATPIKGERAGLDQLFTNLRNGKVPTKSLSGVLSLEGGSGQRLSPTEAQAIGWAYRPLLAGDQATCLEVMNQYCAVPSLPEHQQRAAMRAIPLPEKTYGTLLTILLLPAIEKIHDASLRHRAMMRCAGTAVAVERFRQKFGHWPESLAELPMDLLPAVPLDPYDGQPLRYVRRPDGVTVYSIGNDEVDNGGNVPAERGQLMKEGNDMGVRLFDLSARGLPPIDRKLPLDPDMPVPPPVFPLEKPRSQLPMPHELGKEPAPPLKGVGAKDD
jgi:hypothetical protein